MAIPGEPQWPPTGRMTWPSSVAAGRSGQLAFSQVEGLSGNRQRLAFGGTTTTANQGVFAEMQSPLRRTTSTRRAPRGGPHCAPGCAGCTGPGGASSAPSDGALRRGDAEPSLLVRSVGSVAA
jgi:hypothetical protein